MYWLFSIIGIALIGAPFILSYPENSLEFWASAIAGVILLGISLGKAFSKTTHSRHLR